MFDFSHRATRALTSDEKYEIASAEVEVLQTDIERARTEGEKTLDDLRVSRQECAGGFMQERVNQPFGFHA